MDAFPAQGRTSVLNAVCPLLDRAANKSLPFLAFSKSSTSDPFIQIRDRSPPYLVRLCTAHQTLSFLARNLDYLSILIGIVITQCRFDKPGADTPFLPHYLRVASVIFFFYSLLTLQSRLTQSDPTHLLYQLGYLSWTLPCPPQYLSMIYILLYSAYTLHRFPRLAPISLFLSKPVFVVYSHPRLHNALSQPIHFTLVPP